MKALLKDVKPKQDTGEAKPDTKTEKPKRRISSKTKKACGNGGACVGA